MDSRNELSESPLPVELIDTPETFDEVLPYLLDAPLIGVDTESDSFYAYRERVCLLQFSTDEIDLLIDPLAAVPMERLAEVFANPDQVKVFHDAEFDILLLKRDFNYEFRSLFDTRLALSMLGCARPGLANAVAERFGVELDKKLQRSNWGQRPLSAEQLAYARDDTIYLPDLYYELLDELKERGRLEAHEAECRKLERLRPKERTFDPNGWVRIPGWQELSPRGRRFLHEVFAWREERAKQLNLAPFRILSNGILLMIARRAARHPSSMRAVIDHLKGRQRRALGGDLLPVLERAARRAPLEQVPARRPASPRSARLRPREQAVYDELRTWRKRKAELEEMDAAYVLPRDCLAHLARMAPESLEELETVPGFDAWRIDEFGAELLELLESVRTSFEKRT